MLITLLPLVSACFSVPDRFGTALTLLAEPRSGGYSGRCCGGYGDRMTESVRRPLLRTLVGEALRRHRLAQRRTLAEVAGTACVSLQYLSEVERGRKEPSSEILAAVCDSLRIALSDLLAEVGRDLENDRAPVLRLDMARLHRAQQLPRAHHMHRPGEAMLLAA
jgi:transcriptional regulator with XRE-family HTH domain